ncbi:hypothetical protein [Sorangium sp. So ce1182]|uniref:hypothetical protein n=1 Tax=Sorangium sp. So ce1182 TaxID=3133334 RepID=UPI003F5F7228
MTRTASPWRPHRSTQAPTAISSQPPPPRPSARCSRPRPGTTSRCAGHASRFLNLRDPELSGSRAAAALLLLALGHATVVTELLIELAGLFDERDRPLLAPAPLPGPPPYADVPVVVLGSGDELRALVIPVGPSGDHAPFEAGVHRLRFAIDRARWRSEAPDDVSRYRAASTRVVGW